MKRVYIDRIPSTQDFIEDYVKECKKKREDLIIFAEEQTRGRGTKGRSFSSLKGGVYFSFVMFHSNFRVKDVFNITKQFSMAIVKTLYEFGVDAKIKWPNDIYCQDKKICGMLIKNAFDGDYVDYTIAGIGININNPIPDELKDIAISTKEILGKELELDKIYERIVHNINSWKHYGLYADYSLLLGRTIKIIDQKGNEEIDVAEAILPDGRLKLKSNRILTAEEVSIKL